MKYSKDMVSKVGKDLRHCTVLGRVGTKRDSEGNLHSRKLETKNQLETHDKFQAISNKRAKLNMDSNYN